MEPNTHAAAESRLDQVASIEQDQSIELLNEARFYSICSGILGKALLDVGNGLGKVHLSLAKAGKLVDILLSDEEKVNKANRALFAQERLLRQNIAYIYGNFQTHNFGKQTYDTIIFSVWDDVIYPGALVDKAKELLTPGYGKIIISVSLGLHRLHESKAAMFHFSDLFNSLANSLYLEEVDICAGTWLHIAASRKPGSQEPAWIMQKLSQVFDALESEFISAWVQHLRITETLRSSLQEIHERENHMLAELSQLNDLAQSLRDDNSMAFMREKELSDKLGSAQDSVLTLQVKLAEARTHGKEFSNKLDSIRDEMLALQEQLVEARTQKKELLEKLGSSQNNVLTLQEQLVETRTQKKELLEKLGSSQNNVLTLQEQLTKARTQEKELLEKLKAARNSADKFEQQWRSVLASKRYRVGTALANISKKPSLIFSYIVKLFRKLYQRTRKLLGKCYRLVSKFLITNARRAVAPLKKLKRFPYKGISVIIPTYREIPYLDDCVSSVLRQTLKPSKIQIILSVNGKDEEYFKKLKKKYSGNKRIKVIYTPKVGLSAARNFAMKYVTKDYVTFLDDDDYFTSGYLQEMASHLDKDIQIVCGRLVDECGSTRDKDTYINKELSKISGGGKTKDYLHIGSVFTPAWAKLYQTKLIRDVFCPFREDMIHTEDVLFWTDNCSKLTGSVYCCDADGKEALVRRVLENSMSRPPREKIFAFGIKDRISIINTISERIYEVNLSVDQKRFLITKVNAQTNLVLKYFRLLDTQDQKEAMDLIQSSDNFYLNKSKFASDRGIAFCHNFAPSADASAYVAAKRLPQISNMEGKLIKWKVISSDMSNCRSNDHEFYMFFASYVMESHIKLPKPSYFSELAQRRFALKAFDIVKDESVQYIYSRSMYAGSHDAAYRYKQMYPQVKWYAEFSDPIYMDTNNNRRAPSGTYTGAEAFLNTYWRDVEQMVYEAADVIVFTNEKQREFMLGYNEAKDLNEQILKRSIVLWHPMLDRKFCSILPSSYVLEEEKIHIGYFGTFYPNRQYGDMLLLLKNAKAVLHLFVSKPEELKQIEAANIRIHQAVGHLEYLNIASRMDYLYMNDISFSGPINPYLPSKLADYLSTGTKIIALIKEGSVLSELDHPNLIKTHAIDEEFAFSLKK